LHRPVEEGRAVSLRRPCSARCIGEPV
jgi:hypothetical protein